MYQNNQQHFPSYITPVTYCMDLQRFSYLRHNQSLQCLIWRCASGCGLGRCRVRTQDIDAATQVETQCRHNAKRAQSLLLPSPPNKACSCSRCAVKHRDQCQAEECSECEGYKKVCRQCCINLTQLTDGLITFLVSEYTIAYNS